MESAQRQELNAKDPTAARRALDELHAKRAMLLQEEEKAVKCLLSFASRCEHSVEVASCLQADRGSQKDAMGVKALVDKCTSRLDELLQAEAPLRAWLETCVADTDLDVTEHRVDPLTWTCRSLLDLMRSNLLGGSKTPAEVERYWREQCIALPRRALVSPAETAVAAAVPSTDTESAIMKLQSMVEALTAKVNVLTNVVEKQTRAVQDLSSTRTRATPENIAVANFGSQLQAIFVEASMPDSSKQAEEWCHNHGITSLAELAQHFADFEVFAVSDEGLDLKKSQLKALHKCFGEALAASGGPQQRPEPEPETGRCG